MHDPELMELVSKAAQALNEAAELNVKAIEKMREVVTRLKEVSTGIHDRVRIKSDPIEGWREQRG